MENKQACKIVQYDLLAVYKIIPLMYGGTVVCIACAGNEMRDWLEMTVHMECIQRRPISNGISTSVPFFTTAPYNAVLMKLPFGAGNSTLNWRTHYAVPVINQITIQSWYYTTWSKTNCLWPLYSNDLYTPYTHPEQDTNLRLPISTNVVAWKHTLEGASGPLQPGATPWSRLEVGVDVTIRWLLKGGSCGCVWCHVVQCVEGRCRYVCVCAVWVCGIGGGGGGGGEGRMWYGSSVPMCSLYTWSVVQFHGIRNTHIGSYSKSNFENWVQEFKCLYMV